MKEKTKRKTLKQSDVRDAVIKRALGYDATEVVEEYSEGDEGQIRLIKRKVTTKNVPPDPTALKLLLEQTSTPISSLSDEQLEEEKIRLLKLLSQTKN
ncbi:MAG: hypothetical protein IKZ38_03360 [Clostridia bacterium]|nr:hypothetical protein [Clostridia bacterium]